MSSKAEQKCFSPAGSTVEVVVMKMLGFLGLHFHECGLVENMPFFRSKIHNVGWSGCLANLFPQLRIGLNQGCESNQS